MPFVAGQIVRASALNRIQPITYTSRQSNGGTQTITTTETDSAGTTITFTTTTAALCVVNSFFDFDVAVTGATVLQGRLRVDGVTQSDEAHTNGNSVARNTCGQTWRFSVSGAGIHTAVLRLMKTAAAATAQTDDGHTKMTLTVNEVV
jgi:hypothetical protein